MVVYKMLISLRNLFADIMLCRICNYHEAKQRYDICNDCKMNKNGICVLCGCQIEDKVMYKNQHCPKGKKVW